MRPTSLPFHLAALALILLVVPIRAEKLTRAEIGRRGKAASAFVQIPGVGTGTAFCVHPSGLFITNEHVVRAAKPGQIKLIIDSSLKTQRVFSAEVVRADKQFDLALLRVSSKDELPSLPLGSVDAVTELMDVVVFGFPLGEALSADRKDYPAISVNAGHVSALRRKDGELQRIQIDVSVTSGSSGGAVLDENGKVIGVVASGVVGQRGINLAIPVSHLARFLNAPDLQLTQPELTQANLNKAQEFKVRVVSVVPGRKEAKLRLILRASDEEAREFPMTAKGGVFIASAVPAATDSDERVELTVRFSAGMVSGLANNSIIKLGEKPMRLNAVRRIELKPKPTVQLMDGKTVEGEISGLGPIDILVGEEKVKLDLRKAVQIQVQPAAEVSVVSATVIAAVEGVDVARIEVPIPVRVAGQRAQADPSSVVISPPALSEDKVIKRLPEAFSDLCLGGGGRYLIFQLPRVKKLAIFDINEARSTHYIPLAEDKVTFAAGLDKVVIGLPKKGVVERWSLTNGERELSVYPPFKDEIKTIMMGHAASGSVVINGRFFDLATLRPLPIADQKGNPNIWAAGDRRHVSADGTVFAAWNTHYSPASSTSFVLEGNEVKRYEGGELMHVIPGPDGRTAFTGRGVVTSRLTRIDPEDAKLGYCLPAVRGNYFLSLTSAEGGKGGRVTAYLLGESRPLARPDKIEHSLSFDGWDREAFGVWQRVFFIPQANVIVVLPTSNDQVVLHKFDVDAALEKSGLDYLLITSQPPRIAKAGDTFKYPVVVKAKNGPVTFKLDSGPAGMEVSKEGVVTWKVPAMPPEGDQEVILTIRDARKQEVFHTFSVRVLR